MSRLNRIIGEDGARQVEVTGQDDVENLI